MQLLIQDEVWQFLLTLKKNPAISEFRKNSQHRNITLLCHINDVGLIFFLRKKNPRKNISVHFVYDNETSTRKQRKSEYIESALVVQPDNQSVSFKKE